MDPFSLELGLFATLEDLAGDFLMSAFCLWSASQGSGLQLLDPLSAPARPCLPCFLLSFCSTFWEVDRRRLPPLLLSVYLAVSLLLLSELVFFFPGRILLFNGRRLFQHGGSVPCISPSSIFGGLL